MITDEALGRIRAAHQAARQNPEVQSIISSKNEVIARYQNEFRLPHVAEIDEAVLRSFLYFENNRHWSGLNRQVNRICADMPATRQALCKLADENLSLEDRLTPFKHLKGFGKGIITAILHVAYPDKYAVWNGTSEAALVALGLMPTFERGAAFGVKYEALNTVVQAISEALSIDLWSLDAIWWALLAEAEFDGESGVADVEGISRSSGSFSLERHLHNYLFDAWDELSISNDWDLFWDEEDPQAGYELITPIGRIDLLAKHRREPKWLVIELKRHQTSDQVVGQIMRYVGWVSKHHSTESEEVFGLIVAHSADAKLHYALLGAPNVAFQSYQVDFKLNDAEDFKTWARP